nr:MAG TPA: hypothetical protein [Caudoviricetes sp.]
MFFPKLSNFFFHCSTNLIGLFNLINQVLSSSKTDNKVFLPLELYELRFIKPRFATSNWSRSLIFFFSFFFFDFYYLSSCSDIHIFHILSIELTRSSSI